MGIPTWVVFHQLFQTRQWLQEVEPHEFQPLDIFGATPSPRSFIGFRSSCTNEGGVGQWEVCSAVMEDLGISKWQTAFNAPQAKNIISGFWAAAMDDFMNRI